MYKVYSVWDGDLFVCLAYGEDEADYWEECGYDVFLDGYE